MTTYRLYLTDGHTYVGDDERDPDDMVDAIANAADWTDELPKGWGWAAGLYFRPEHVIASKLCLR